MSPELRDVSSSTDECFSYADIEDLDTCLEAIELLDSYVTAEGPFDVILAFSQGAIIAASYLGRKMQMNELSRQSNMPFKCAILFLASSAYDFGPLKAQLEEMTRDVDGGMISIPTAIIYSRNDTTIDREIISGICAPDKKEVYVHDGGHEIPGARMNSAVKACVQIIRSVISMATIYQ